MRKGKERDTAGAESSFFLIYHGQSPYWRHPPHSPMAGPGPGAGSLPPELSLPLAGPPPAPHFRAALPALSLPELALSSSALGSLTHCFPSSLPSLPLSPRSGASPSPGGALATRVPACSSLQAPAPLRGPPPRPGGPLQLFQFSSYREVECKEPGSQAQPCQASVTLGKWLPSLDLISSCQTREGFQLASLGP